MGTELTNLDLDLATALGPGRSQIPLTAEVEREITESDIVMLAQLPANVEPIPIKRITQRHHQVAKLLALGTPEGEVALISGYTSSRISILKNSPAMQELIALYELEIDEKFSGVVDHLTGMSEDAILLIRERLEEAPDDFSIKDLQNIAEMALDRTGHPRAKEMNTNLNVNFANDLDAARQRALKVARGEIVEAEVIEEK